MWKLMVYFLVLMFTAACCQEVRHVRLVDPMSYVKHVSEEVMGQLEALEWSELKLPDFEQHVDEEFLENHVIGTVTFARGFLATIQHLDIVKESVQQIWTSTTATSGQVEVRAKLRMIDVGIGFDVNSQLTNADGKYTALITIPEITVDFSIIKDLYANMFSVGIITKISTTTYKPHIGILPKNKTADIIGALFVPTTIFEHVTTWGNDTIQPITLKVVLDKVEFPRICYNCPIVV